MKGAKKCVSTGEKESALGAHNTILAMWANKTPLVMNVTPQIPQIKSAKTAHLVTSLPEVDVTSSTPRQTSTNRARDLAEVKLARAANNSRSEPSANLAPNVTGS